VVSSADEVRREKQAIIGRYAQSSDAKGLMQVLATLLPLALLWWVATAGFHVSFWFTVAAIPALALLTLRVFALMHECGHYSLFSSRWLNRAFGFALGVIAGMPQYVWSQHHNFHHAHNGNWDKYRGPYATRSVGEYAAMTRAQQRLYRYKCGVASAPVAGFIYLVFNPRYTWLKGSIGLLLHMARNGVGAHSSYRSRYWKSAREYWHMSWNNIVLVLIWALMCRACGPLLFFSIYLLTVSIAGGAGIVLFTVQHNFEHSYASENHDWDYHVGGIEGTSFLILPRWLNWVTLDIAYHHVHHLSATIPNYCLVQCHDDNPHLFADVTRVKLSGVLGALKFILWDPRARRIISVSEYVRLP
jgi:omega-6 fatty acid desaturase (delta-12 desaturase)